MEEDAGYAAIPSNNLDCWVSKFGTVIYCSLMIIPKARNDLLHNQGVFSVHLSGCANLQLQTMHQ
jgi:hypothetical protein